MALLRISDNVYNVGVLNPFLRIAHIDKKCPYGTSYNSYLIDDRKTCLIDIVNSNFFDDFLYNLGLVCDIGAVDYLVLNRVIPQQGESIKRMLEISPKTIIVCTEVAKTLLDNILNTEYNCVTVKSGDKLTLGNSVMEFIETPMPSTPDSMCTYFDNDSVLFSGSLFGADFCEPKGLDEDMLYVDEYMEELKNYYNYYMYSNRKYVLKALESLGDRLIYYIAPQNGVVITDRVREVVKNYSKWSSEKVEENAVVLYVTTGGYTKELAQAVAEAFESKNIKTEIIDMKTITADECAKIVENVKYIAVGACTVNKNLPHTAIVALSKINCLTAEDKIFFTFGSYGWSGEGVDMLAVYLQLCGMKQLAPAFKVCMKPTENDIEKIKSIITESLGEVK